MPAEDPNDMHNESASSRPNPSDESSADVQTEPKDEEKSATRRKIEESLGDS
jgi:hypothetical protein